VEPELANVNIRVEGNFEYMDSNGTVWMVSSVPFFPTVTGNSLIVLVFNQKSLAETTLPDLKAHIVSTESKVTNATGAIVGGCFGGVLLLLFFVIIRITSPLESLREISMKVLQISSEDESHRDFSQIVMHPLFTQSNVSDEIAALTNDYFQVVCNLSNAVEVKKSKPKYPENPFHAMQIRTWDAFLSKFFNTVVGTAHVSIEERPNVISVDDNNDLDVLGSLQRKGYKQVSAAISVDQSDIELGKPSSSTTEYQEIFQAASTYRAATESNSGKTIDPGAHVTVSCLTSIKSVFYFLALLIVGASLIVLIITVLTLKTEGHIWMDSTGEDLDGKQMITLGSIAMVKSVYVKHFFLQILVDIKVTAQFVTNIFNGKYINPDEYLKSYSLDLNSPYVSLYPKNDSYSGYFIHDDSGAYQTAAITKNTSLFDIKYQSLNYNRNRMLIAQYGHENGGFLRSYPYVASNTYASPTSCTVQSTVEPHCLSLYQNSKCSGSSNVFPEYDPRCRSWYQFAREQTNTDEAYVLYPRVQLSTGKYVVTSVVNIMQESNLVGVINSNSLVQELSDAVNQLKILEHGYSYIIDAKNTSQVIMHPDSTCGYVHCSEGFSEEEYSEFYNTVLYPIEKIISGNNGAVVKDSYKKGGSSWRLSYSLVKVSTIYYAVITTVPNDDITAASRYVQNSIDLTVTSIIIAFAICMAFFVALLIYFIRILVREIVDPINELRQIASLLATGDLNSTIPQESSSLDMKILLDAFSKLIVAMRFGNDSFSRGNIEVARQVYSEAMDLFTNTGNIKGLGACHNNLGAVEAASGAFEKAENHYNTAIEYCKEAISKAESGDDSSRLQKTLSDRRGNLAILYLERTDMSSQNLKIAFDLLEELLLDDKKS